jgi:hypothetical protein
MGKNLTIYFDEESIDYIEKVEGKGTLINQLIKDHFSNDLENLIRRSKELNFQLEEINNKIEKIRNNKNALEMDRRRKTLKSIEQQEKDELASIIQNLLKEDKITLEEWESCFDLNGIIKEKAKELSKK